jgi:PKD domain
VNLRRGLGGAVAMLAVASALTVGASSAGAFARSAQAFVGSAGAFARSAQAFGGSAGAFAKTFAGATPDVPTGAHVAARPVAHIADVYYGGGPALRTNRPHLVFWAPAGSGLSFTPRYVSTIETFFRRVAAASRSTTNIFGLVGQYRPAAYDSIYGGAVLDTDRLPANDCTEPTTAPRWTRCLTDGDLETEIDSVVNQHHLPTTGSDIYFLLLPDGLGSCIESGPGDCALGGSTAGSFCGYHSSTSTVLYAVIPYNAVPPHCQSTNPRPNHSAADPTLSTLAHELAETITDPFGNAWFDPSGEEIADLCITAYGPNLGGAGNSAWDETIDGGHYYLQELWSNADSTCEPRARPDSVSFTSPPRGRVGQPVSFTAHGSDPEGRIVSYAWFFGLGENGAGRAVRHTFTRAGTYRILVRATDSWDNYSFASRTIRVTG